MADEEKKRAYLEQFNRLKGLGYDATKVAAALLPILAGSEVAQVISAAEAALGVGASGSAPPAAAATAAATAAAATAAASVVAAPDDRSERVARLLATVVETGIDMESIQLVYDSCRSAGDFTPLVHLIGRAMSSPDCLRLSFVMRKDGAAAVASSALTGFSLGAPASPASTAHITAVSPAPSAGGAGNAEAEARALQRPTEYEGGESATASSGPGTTASVAAPVTPAPAAAAVSVSGGASGVASAPTASTPTTPATRFAALEPCDIDLPAVVQAYTLLRDACLASEPVSNALFNASCALAATLQSTAARFSSFCQLRPFFILSQNPQLEDPLYFDSVVAKLCIGYERLKPSFQQTLSHWFATVGSGGSHGLSDSQPDFALLGGAAVSATAASVRARTTGGAADAASASSVPADTSAWDEEEAAAIQQPVAAMRRVVDFTQQYITVLLYAGKRITTAEIQPPVVWLSMIHSANEEYLALHGRRALPYEMLYNEVISTEIDLRADFQRWKEQARGRDRFSFCSHSFLLDPAAKAIILAEDAAAQQHASAMTSIFAGSFEPYFQLRVRRSNLLEDALQGIVNVPNKTNLKKPLKVKFAGEEGLDEGGVRREFFSLLVKQLLIPDFGMFVEDDTKLLYFNPDALESSVTFELVGSLLALALYNNVLLEVNFPRVTFRKLKGEPVTLHDLADFKPDVARNLRSLLDYKGDDVEDVFCLNFTATRESWGTPVVEELLPGGAEMPVTAANKKAYVSAYLKWLVTDSVKKQFDAFYRGFHQVAGGPALELFRTEELQLAVVGSAALDFHSLERVTEYEEPFTADHPTIVHFWSVVHSLSPAEQKLFLAFCTGSDRAPIKGLGSMRFIISRAGPDSDRLISAHTCFNHILVPEYSSRDKMRTKLLTSIQHAEGFGMI